MQKLRVSLKIRAKYNKKVRKFYKQILQAISYHKPPPLRVYYWVKWKGGGDRAWSVFAKKFPTTKKCGGKCGNVRKSAKNAKFREE